LIDDNDWADLLARAGDPPRKTAAAKSVSQPLPVVDLNQKEPEHFLHFCHCGQWGAWGYGVDYRRGKNGDWYCFAHRPLNKVAAALTK
jgi:hypothetical protein